MRLASLCRGTSASLVLILFVVGLAIPAWADDSRPIDAHHSHMTVFVSKSGIFSRFAHDHEIAAPLAAGTVDAGAPSVELRVESRTLRVLDPDLAERKRSEVQRTMLGPKVLDVERFPEIPRPSLRRFDERRRETDLVGVPPSALARRQDEFVPAPVVQIGRVRNPDVRA